MIDLDEFERKMGGGWWFNDVAREDIMALAAEVRRLRAVVKEVAAIPRGMGLTVDGAGALRDIAAHALRPALKEVGCDERSESQSF